MTNASRHSFLRHFGRGAAPYQASDLADMGTAFGLDAITTLEAELDSGLREPVPATPPSRFEHRSRRRSGL